MMPGRLLVRGDRLPGARVNNLSERLCVKEDFRYRSSRYDNPSSQLLRMYRRQPGRDPDAEPYATSAFFVVDRRPRSRERANSTARAERILRPVHDLERRPPGSEAPGRGADPLYRLAVDFEYTSSLPEPDRVFFLDISGVGRKDDKERGQERISRKRYRTTVRSADAARRIAAHYKWTMIRCKRDGGPPPARQLSEEIYDLLVSLFDSPFPG